MPSPYSSPHVQEALQALHELSQDPQVRELALQRDRQILNELTLLQQARQEGEQIGIQKGEQIGIQKGEQIGIQRGETVLQQLYDEGILSKEEFLRRRAQLQNREATNNHTT